MLALWCFVTIGHFVLTARWVRVSARTPSTGDELLFTTVLASVGTLAASLHLVSLSVGLNLWAVAALLAVGHGGMALHMRGRAPAGTSVERPDPVTRGIETAASLVLAAVTIQWILVAAPGMGVRGTDAAHYHIPNAVNFALGASPFDLPGTQHLYPMGSSMLAAWFILPVGDSLLTDLTMVMPFLLLASSLGWLFRLTTGQSGLAWMTWPSLLLFTTPLFREASLMSADLLFAASLVAFAATLFAIIQRRRLSQRDVWLSALAGGLLLGTKTTGLVGALLVGLPIVGAMPIVLRGATGPTEEKPTMGTWVLAGLLAVAAGGIWLVRNWWVWGSPVVPNGLTVFGVEIFRGVPYEPTTYLSVLGDLENDPTYPLAAQTRQYLDQWLSAWYLPLVMPVALIPIDGLVAWRRGLALAGIGMRLALLALAIGTLIPMLWLLTGAPWTSLEWTRGFSLRYGLPWLALLPLVSFAALYPASLHWYRSPAASAIAGIGLVLGSLWVFGGVDPNPPFPPWPTLVAVVVGLGALLLIRLALASSGTTVLMAVAVIAAISGALGQWVAALDSAAAAEAGRAAALAPRTSGQQAYDQLRLAEGRLGRTCTSRRFFATTRFDAPLDLQDVKYTNQVFYARRDVAVTAAVRPLGACDYVVTSRAVLATQKGMDLLAALSPNRPPVETVEAGPFVVLGTP
ncbi:MAG: hypothetical protein HY701_12495 [Gemmatimonadetes bacterium]|nr:hypothetical protein [Gemmatimonadota bacterium]